ncbi:MAG: TRAP transporter substrate-binding protein [Ramlibacter sp.]
MQITFRHILAALALTVMAMPLAQAQTQRTARLGYILPESHPQGAGAKKLAELVAAKTSGRLRVQTFRNGALGDELKMISQVQGGVLDLLIVTTSPLAATVKPYGVLDIPFLFENEAEVDAVLGGPVGGKLLAAVEPYNMVGLGWMEAGFRNMTNSKRAINRVDDFAGLKVRTMQNKIFIEAFNGLGTNPVPMAFTELFTAMETKAVDGAEGPAAVIESNKWFEVQKYVTLTRHAFASFVVVASRKFWDSLTPEDQKALRGSVQEAGVFERKLNREKDTEAVASLRKAGMQVGELPPAEKAQMRARVKAVAESVAKDSGEALVAEVNAEIAKVRK